MLYYPHLINSLLFIYILYMIKSLPEHRSTYCPRTAQSVLFPQSWPPVPQCRCLGHRTWYQPGTRSAGKPGCSQSSCCWLYTTDILWLSQIDQGQLLLSNTLGLTVPLWLCWCFSNHIQNFSRQCLCQNCLVVIYNNVI